MTSCFLQHCGRSSFVPVSLAPVDPAAESSNPASMLDISLLLSSAHTSLAPEHLKDCLSAAGDRFASKNMAVTRLRHTCVVRIHTQLEMSALRSTQKKSNDHDAKLTGTPFYSSRADNSSLLSICFCTGGLLTLCDSVSLDRHLLLLYEMNIPKNKHVMQTYLRSLHCKNTLW